jgi:hypothetical protein
MAVSGMQPSAALTVPMTTSKSIPFVPIRDLLDRSPAERKRLVPPTELPPVDTDVDPDFDLDLVAPFVHSSHPSQPRMARIARILTMMRMGGALPAMISGQAQGSPKSNQSTVENACRGELRRTRLPGGRLDLPQANRGWSSVIGHSSFRGCHSSNPLPN